MFSSPHFEFRKRGFALPLTMILLIFGTLILLAVASQLNRTANELNSFKTVSEKQNVLENAIEAAGYILIQNSSLEMSSTWSEIEAFKQKISNHSGIESYYWVQYLDQLTSETPCIDLSNYVNAMSNDPSLGNGKYAFDIYAYEIGNKYLITASLKDKASGESINKAGAGLVANAVDVYLPAVKFAASDRVFSVMRKVGGGKGNPKIIGDMIYGKAIILDDVNLLLTDSSTPGEIITGSLTAKSVNIDNVEELYPGWYSHISDDPYTIYQKWVKEYLDTFPATALEIILNENYNVPTVDPEMTFIISAPDSDTSPEFSIFFNTSGLRIEYGTNAFSVPATAVSENMINIKVMGDAVIGNDPHKISPVTGKYNIAVYGDVYINTNISYNYLVDYINNGKGNSPVANKTKDVSVTMISDMLNESREDVLSLAAVGGDLKLLFGSSSSTHGNKTIMGNLLALKYEGKGGDVSFPDIEKAVKGNGHTPQLFIFGALTSYTFDKDHLTPDLLNSIVAVAGYFDPSQSMDFLNSSRRIIGMMVW